MTEPSPLAETNPLSLQELFDTDPLKLNRDDVSQIVAELRAQRERWEATEGKKRAPKAPVQNLSLEDLGL
jgi:hypothetical protein